MAAPDFSLSDRAALLTGAGRGIGLGIAQAFASAGCAVAIQDIDRDAAESEAENIRKSGGRAIALGGDVHDIDAVPGWVDQTIRQLGGIHILVNNAAVQSQRSFLEWSPREMEQQLRADLVSPIVLCQRVVPIMREQHWGRILNIGSIQGRSGNLSMLPYSMSKVALNGLTTALARHVVKDGITVNLLAPGFFKTLRNAEVFATPQKEAEAHKWVPVGRAGEPEDIAGIALALCSPAGSYVTGQIIYVDGGMSSR